MKKVFLFLVSIIITSSALPQTHSVTFQVNMNAQKNYGFFDPSKSGVKIRGSFNGWGETEMNDENSDGIYDVTINELSGTIEYKFFYRDISGSDKWEEIPNRTMNIDSTVVLEEVYFMDDPGSNVLVNVYFRVNMEFEIASGRFDPKTDIVFVRGNFNGWGTADTCSPSAVDPVIYEKNVPYIAKIGDTIHYKFNINDSNWEVDFWENSGGHRLIGISQQNLNDKYAEDPVIYPSEFFNGLNPENLTKQDIEITFMVDVNSATDLNGASFSKIENVYLCGGTAPLGWGWNTQDKSKAIFMFDDGTNGDLVSEDKIWSIKVNFAKYTTISPFNYKYGVNYDLPANNGSNDNENAPGQDHWIQLSSDLVSATVKNVFGVATTAGNPHPLENVVTTGVEKNSDVIPSEFLLKQNYPNPFNPSTTINFSIPFSSNVSVIVYDILGHQIKTLLHEDLSAGTYNVTFNSSDLNTRISSGIYLCRITAAGTEQMNRSFTKTIKMTLLK